MPLRDHQRSPTVLVCAIPDFELRPLLREQFDDRREIFVSRAVHSRFAVGIDCIQVRAQIQEHLNCLKHLRLGSSNFICCRAAHSNATSDVQRGATIGIGLQRFRAQLDQQAHVGNICRSCGH